MADEGERRKRRRKNAAGGAAVPFGEIWRRSKRRERHNSLNCRRWKGKEGDLISPKSSRGRSSSSSNGDYVDGAVVDGLSVGSRFDVSNFDPPVCLCVRRGWALFHPSLVDLQ